MALILAIETDRRQASRISAIAREELHAELVIADSAEHALAALDSRRPDLILTPQLLSPKDEAVLDERLRQLDNAGWKVQTLMIPVLASSKGRAGKKDGLLGRLRRGKDEPTTNGGCDPSVFADQIKEYLERAAEDHAARARQVEEHGEAEPLATPIRSGVSSPTASAPKKDTVVLATESAIPAVETAVAESLPTNATAFAEPDDSHRSRADGFVPQVDVFVTAAEGFEPPPEVYSPPPVPYERSAVDAPVAEAASFGESEAISQFSESETIAQFAGPDPIEPLSEPEPIAALVSESTFESAAALVRPSAFESATDHGPAVELPVARPAEVEVAAVVAQTVIHRIEADPFDDANDAFNEFVQFDDLGIVDSPLVGLGELAHAISTNDRHTELNGETVLDALELLDGPEIPPPFDFAHDTGPRQQRGNTQPAAILENEPEPSADDFDFEADLWMPLPLTASPRWPTLEGPSVKAALLPSFDAPPDEPVEFAPTPKLKKKKPVQDEWGLFDPVQCGFAALLAKLDEVTDKDDGSPQPTPTSAA